MDTVNRIARIRMLRNVGGRPDLREGAVSAVPADEAERLIAAALAEPAAEPEPAPTPEPPPADKPVKKPRTR